MDVGQVADELYDLRPEDFTAARDARAAQARQAGDRAAAADIKALRRPTVGAWLANLLAHRSPSSVDAVLSLGAELRRAQESLDGAALRRLSGRRQQVVSELRDEARRLAQAEGARPSDAALAELEQTLDAAVTDPAAAEVLRAGHLSAALTPGAQGLLQWVPAPDHQRRAPSAPASPASRPRSRPAAAPGARAAARRAARDEERARQVLARAEERRETAARERAVARAALAEANDALAEADRALQEARNQLKLRVKESRAATTQG
jgi:hypothetical protein